MEASETLERRIETIALKRGRKVTLVGHSLGGLMARGLAGRRPDLVEGIVTHGQPDPGAGGGAPDPALRRSSCSTRLQQAGLGGLMGEDCTSGDCARESWRAGPGAAATPGSAFTSVFSRRDGIVDWRSCLDPQAETVEVTTSHLGMAFDPVVLGIVTRALADHRARRDQLSSSARSAAVPDAEVG